LSGAPGQVDLLGEISMAIFGRSKPKDTDSAPEPATQTPPALAITPLARESGEIGLPPIRPPQQEAPPMTLAPKPTAIPAAPGLPARPPVPAPIGVPARPGRSDGADRRTLVVGRGISLQGTVSDAERLVVEGTVESQMIQAAELHVSPAGVFRGEVQVEDAEIAGLFDGTLTVRGNLTIRGTGKVNGIARYGKLSVEEGGQISGRMEMLAEAGGAPPPSIRVPMPHNTAVEVDA
jgi:cytoskeletal protein CcmA (bactofilin family)